MQSYEPSEFVDSYRESFIALQVGMNSWTFFYETGEADEATNQIFTGFLPIFDLSFLGFSSNSDDYFYFDVLTIIFLLLLIPLQFMHRMVVLY